MKQQQTLVALLMGAMAVALTIQAVAGVITVQIGGANRLNTLSRQRERYNCYWDCDLVGCQIARDDDECAYDCEKICRVRYDYAATGRSGIAGEPGAPGQLTELQGKSAPGNVEPVKPAAASENEIAPELVGAGTSVRLHLPRNASARNFAIWERCSADQSTGKLTEKPFNL